MEIKTKQNERGPIIAAVLALIVLGLGSLFLTWQSIKHQRAVVEEHMVLSGRVIVRGVEANLVRIMRSLRNNPALSQLFPSLAQELFQEITASGEVLFVALYAPGGQLLLASSHGDEEMENLLPRGAFDALDQLGHWHGMTLFGQKQALVIGLQARPGVASVCGLTPPGQGANRGPGHQGGHGMRHGRNRDHLGGLGPADDAPGPEVPLYFVAGLNAEKNLAQFHLYRRAALLQTGYVFLAAVVLWSLAFAYLRRRDQASRVGRMERFQSKLLDNMPDGLVTLGPDGEIMAANGSARALLAPVTPTKNADAEPPPPPYGVLAGRNWAEFPFADLRGGTEWKQYEYQGRRLEMLCVPFQDPQPPDEDDEDVYEERLILIRDRTKLKSLEDDLAEARRLAAIGSLAAGVAHEVRNPLSSLRGFAQFFADKFKGNKPYDDYAGTMVQEADRLNRVVTDLLFLARPRRLDPVKMDLAEMAASLERLMRFDLEHKRVRPGLDLEARTVLADPDALKQVLLNLVTNALDAMPEENGEVRIISRSEPDGVWVSVEDNGPGIPEQDREQAMEPFFTSKRKGTGLGLAIVNNIMRAHRGRAVIEDSPEGGAAVRLFFPHGPTPTDQDHEQQ
ncbi:His Kinase A (phospho-acceptor) domain-containing protein [Paucidesulfovibrio gracilis DSM 16080]|uniref:histidine kinase n=1 Tax=Paucidesulfovibrio gracilis DSM 16080 TaxID=1121449 RepID=A0A1T4W586_9BACT|nr:ATP-binding protein [Paucidesulfovibrio gracilis]SKA72412.1 His Kinase A (phospho-acceptor) domain-containing protein [Paucidesulfovibrio gracilis DSM 16080]